MNTYHTSCCGVATRLFFCTVRDSCQPRAEEGVPVPTTLAGRLPVRVVVPPAVACLVVAFLLCCGCRMVAMADEMGNG